MRYSAVNYFALGAVVRDRLRQPYPRRSRARLVVVNESVVVPAAAVYPHLRGPATAYDRLDGPSTEHSRLRGPDTQYPRVNR